jgi:threonyl-tRNA synthetase
LGSLERFIGVYIEHCAGHFPLWLAPVQAKILNLTEKHLPYAEELKKKMFDEGIRVELDHRNEKLGFKVREAQVAKVPYMVVIGDKEMETNTVSVRYRTGENYNNLSIDNFIGGLRAEIKSRSLQSYLTEAKK